MANPLIDDIADLGSENEDEEFDEDGDEQPRRKEKTNGALEDSSEEEEDDDDEEAARAIREGFIVDEDEDEDEHRRSRRERRKRRRAEREEEDAALDEEDLDLIGEANPELEARLASQSKYKRLKRGHREDRATTEPRGVEEIFSDDEEDVAEVDTRRRPGMMDDMDDFIEEDEFEDDIQRALEEEREVARPGKSIGHLPGIQEAGLDESAIEDMRMAFGDGTEYDWALDMEARKEEEEQGGEKALELKDVFEPEQLVDRLLTDEDNAIRAKDVPERLQIARKPFKELELTEEEMDDRLGEESLWISNLLFPKRRMHPQSMEPFKQAVRKVLEFMNVEDYEIPFIFQHRKDYIIQKGLDWDPDDPDAPAPGTNAERLLNQDDLWEVFELDLRWRGLAEKRDTLKRTYENLKAVIDREDPVFEDLINAAVSMEEVQDIHDYIHFQYSAPLKDISLMDAETNGTQKRVQTSGKTMFEQLRASKVYNFVRGFGITADGFAENVTATSRRQFTEDPSEKPDDMADSLLDPPLCSTGSQVIKAGKAMYIEELVMNPRLRTYIRKNFYENGMIDSVRTEKGLKKITEDHPYYEFKYLRNQDFGTMIRRPDLYLRMLKAESEGMVEVKFKLANSRALRERMCQLIESDNFSEVADAWNELRREVIDVALARLEKIIVKGVKETLKTECENELARQCRKKLAQKLDQAPYKPKGMEAGTLPTVMALSNGKGQFNRDAICWAFLEHDGRVLENGKFVDLRVGNPEKYIPDGKDVADFIEVVRRRQPDVLGVSGFSVETKKLVKDLQDLIDRHDLSNDDDDKNHDDVDGPYKPKVVLVQDEVARLYYTTDRAQQEFPGLPPMTKYCVALARYLQSPLKEYASLGKNITSIIVDPNQSLLPPDKLLRYFETAMVDYVNLVGVDVNEAVNDSYTANLLPFVSGLGVRKANSLLKTINTNGGIVNTRDELVGDPDRKILPAVGPKVFANCASFLYIEYDSSDPESDYMDNTRVHPEDYELARKMAGDAMDMDEEDIQGMANDEGPGAVIRMLVREERQEAVNDLVLEEYAEQLEKKFNQRKRATLETIKEELQNAYEELRKPFAPLTTDEIFTMLTGETRESLAENMIVPVQIKRTFPDHIEVKLDCGIEGTVSENDFPEGVGGPSGVEPRQIYQVHQTVQAKLVYINRKALSAVLSLREDALRRPYRKEIDHGPSEWDDAQEQQDKKNAEKEKEVVSGRAQRVVNHPLFFSFNAAQAEEYLGSKEPGEVVIRPSSKGIDHLAVTWKVADNCYQHIDVLELDKENEFSLGKTLKVGKYSYSDLDELIVNHVESMAKKVTEMMKDEHYQKGSKQQTEQWLKTYTEANPMRSKYAFCINPKYPGYFTLCFKAGKNADLGSWPVKVVPNAYELQRYQYPDMKALKNGFKLLFTNSQSGRRR